MRLKAARARWLALLFGAVLTADLPAAPEVSPPEGFVRETLPTIRGSVLRPKDWFFRCVVPAFPFYQCSRQAFTGPTEYASGVSIHVMQRTDQPADEFAAARIAQIASGNRVLRGWTKKGTPAEPFTTYGLVCVMQNEETGWVRWTCEFVFVANRVTNTLYQCNLYAPVGEWKEVETPGEKMLASLRLDPGL